MQAFYGQYIWTDGENIYYSGGSNQYILDKSTSTWSEKTWNGFPFIRGDRIWTDGENIYFSDGDQCVLNKSTSTWEEKTWDGYNNIYGQYIWTDGDNIYCSSYDYGQYILNKSTSTWELKTWNGLIYFSGSEIWTDSNNIYYSDGYDQKILVHYDTQTSYQINTSSATNISIAKASTSVQKSEIVGTANQISATPDVSGNGTTISLPQTVVADAAAGNTALQPDDVGALSTSDMNELLALIVDDPV